ncbi:RsmB/NOP family class I SAM-dependent RNA methyltransferase [Penaeicola halotolerans]|uniref:RsmB/NOP family class I SAM-dependent RNA methyltransferase n=1 Tax=Penaeicola halotolerans TaxID=2793196 RepID=UPI003F693B7C
MRLHKNTTEAVAEGLYQIFHDNLYADKVVEKLLKTNKRWGARDRAFIAENIYEIVRWWRLITTLTPIDQSKKVHYYRAFGTWAILQGHDLPDWEEFTTLRPDKIKKQYEALDNRAILESIPDWLDQKASMQLGDLWPEEIAALNDQAEVVLRVNRLKTTPKELASTLASTDVQAYLVPDYPDALVLEKRQNIFLNPAFKQGLFEVQDGSSQRVAAALDVAPGMRVIDACAGAGGKSLHIAAMMQNKGRIISMDVEEWKLFNLKIRARRAGVQIIESRLIENNKTIKRLHESADRLLLDVPCSGLGVLRRNPDTKWKLSPDSIEHVKTLQEDILHNYSKMLKSGGIMVYATCSILPEENNLQVEKFLASEAGKDFTLIHEERVLAHQSGFDGFYIAKMQKK